MPNDNPEASRPVTEQINDALLNLLLNANGIEDKSNTTFYKIKKQKNINFPFKYWRSLNPFTSNEAYDSETYNHRISAKVLERLLLRHSVLRELEALEGKYEISNAYRPRQKNLFSGKLEPASNAGAAGEAGSRPEQVGEPKGEAGSSEQPGDDAHGKEDGRTTPEDPSPSAPPNDQSTKGFIYPEYDYDEVSEKKLRVYRLATTDLFVEKAISYLEEDYNRYVLHGIALFSAGFASIFIGIVTSFASFFFGRSSGSANFAGNIVDILHGRQLFPHEFISVFVKGFTFYGFLVLFAVACSGLGKAMMDQAERLRERRHSLRQGRLYIHLSNGEVTIEEIEKAFDWNVSKGNAFANIKVEASAPWGGVIKEALKTLPEIFKRAKT